MTEFETNAKAIAEKLAAAIIACGDAEPEDWSPEAKAAEQELMELCQTELPGETAGVFAFTRWLKYSMEMIREHYADK